MKKIVQGFQHFLKNAFSFIINHTLPFSSESPWTARKTLKRSFSRDYLEKELNELWNNDFEISLQNITPFSDKKQFWEIILRRISWNRERRQHLFLLLGSHRRFLPLSFSSLVKTCKEILNFFFKVFETLWGLCSLLQFILFRLVDPWNWSERDHFYGGYLFLGNSQQSLYCDVILNRFILSPTNSYGIITTSLTIPLMIQPIVNGRLLRRSLR